MSFTNKINILEIIIGILKEHEQKMDTLLEKMLVVDQPIIKAPKLNKTFKEYDSN